MFRTLLSSILISLFFSFAYGRTSHNGDNSLSKEYFLGDSIMNQVIYYSNKQASIISEFDGKVYMKGYMKIKKQNFLLKIFPWAFPFDNSHQENIFEIENELSFRMPNNFNLKPVFYRCSNSKPFHNFIDLTPLLNLKISNNKTAVSKYILPGSEASKDVYQYRLDSIFETNGRIIQKISFIPKRKNLKVLNGSLYVLVNTPYIQKIEASGYIDIAKFNLSTTFDRGINHFMLPKETHIKLSYNILKNQAEQDYLCLFSYTNVKLEHKDKKTRNLDLSQNFAISSNKLELNNDSSYWRRLRKEDLTISEVKLLNQHDTIVKDTLKRFDFLKFSERIVSTSSFTNENLQWRYSGLLNPALIGYSKLNGIVLRQQLLFTTPLKRDRNLMVMPEIGFGFKQKELFYRLETNWLYKPNKLGNLFISVRNGNKGFSSSFIDKVNESLDSLNMDFKNLNIDYYRDYHLQVENSYELCNGLMLFAGVSYNFHKPVKKESTNDHINGTPGVDNNYADFVPYIRFSWTPLQYYRFIRTQKINLFSPFPTFSLEFSKGISNVLGSDSQFNKVEFDVHQVINLRVYRNLSYRLSAGSFFNQRSEYFVDFRYFQKSNYPDTWTDHIGGIFNLLDTRWYYSSPQYAQLHLMYESPFILLHPFKRISRFFLSERIYISQLYTSQKPCYTEVGYGLGNYIFNIAVFSNFHNGHYAETGFRFSLELGRYW